MMERCYDLHELGDPDTLASDDPRRRHLETCPRCRALLNAQAAFLDPGDTSDLGTVAQLAAADAHLQRRLDVALRPARPRRRVAWYAAAAVLAVCALGLAATDFLRPDAEVTLSGGTRLRGEAPIPELAVTPGPDSLRVAWPDAPAADTFVFVFLAEDLSELGRREVHGPYLALVVTDPLAAATFCQGFAVAQGDIVARSAIVRVRSARE